MTRLALPLAFALLTCPALAQSVPHPNPAIGAPPVADTGPRLCHGVDGDENFFAPVCPEWGLREAAPNPSLNVGIGVGCVSCNIWAPTIDDPDGGSTSAHATDDAERTLER